jgi:hypothetical protein
VIFFVKNLLIENFAKKSLIVFFCAEEFVLMLFVLLVEGSVIVAVVLRGLINGRSDFLSLVHEASKDTSLKVSCF